MVDKRHSLTNRGIGLEHRGLGLGIKFLALASSVKPLALAIKYLALASTIKSLITTLDYTLAATLYGVYSIRRKAMIIRYTTDHFPYKFCIALAIWHML